MQLPSSQSPINISSAKKLGVAELLLRRALASLLDAFAVGAISVAVSAIALGSYGQNIDQMELMYCGVLAFCVGFLDCFLSLGPIVLTIVFSNWMFGQTGPVITF